ncbi:MAG: hypothetical protein SGPRY_013957, partial [Prymnesium sp.]
PSLRPLQGLSTSQHLLPLTHRRRHRLVTIGTKPSERPSARLPLLAPSQPLPPLRQQLPHCHTYRAVLTLCKHNLRVQVQRAVNPLGDAGEVISVCKPAGRMARAC